MPQQHQSIDEGMIKYKGRYSIKQYMPNKPIKRGMKVWMRCDSVSGFCHDFRINIGRFDEFRGVGLGAKVVKHLTRDIKGKNFHIVMDNFFSSVNLFRTLKQNGIQATGTIKKNAVFLPECVRTPNPKLQRGDSVARQHGDLVATAWQDTKQVTNICSSHNNYI